LPVVKVGNPGDQGVAQISEMRFTVSDVLPGAIIVQVNMAGSPGDVGIWNSVITVGGTKDSKVTTSCQDQDTTTCKAAFLSMHLTASSSAYIENVWGWTADHDIDGGPMQIISAGRGLLVEATNGTWLVGTGFEHHWLYNYNFHHAQNVYAGLLQSETPYMQGLNAVQTVPAPWVADARFGDPDYSWCGGGDQKCRTALATNVDGGNDIFLYNSASWSFFNGPWDGTYTDDCTGTCQTNMMRVTAQPENLVWYAINTREADTLVLDDNGNPQQFNNPGGWSGPPGKTGGFGGNLVAYRTFASWTGPLAHTELK
jgi:glucan 1,3-beta-glucosidase